MGYGGTKTEMERLIADASKMTDVQSELGITVAEGDMSFANIANAISVVQKNMGLMGTTALEASGTISGSTGSMKSAWENLVTGIADDNADFETLVNNLVESIVGKDGEGGFISNMLPRIQTALDGIVKMVVSLTDTLLPQIVVIGTDLITNLVGSISENLPALLSSAEQILQTLINGVLLLLPQLVPMVMQIIGTLVTTLLENLPMIIDAGCKVLVSLVQGISDMLPTLIPTIVSAVMLMVETLIDNIDLIIDAGIEIILALADGLIFALPDLIDKAPVIITKLINAIVNNFPKIVTMSGELIGKMASGLIVAIPKLLTAIPEIIAQLVVGFFKFEGEYMQMGFNLVSGIWEGISGSLGWIKDKLSGWIGDVTKFVKKMFGINSPSRLFKEEIGTNLALGVGEGFSETMGDVSAEMAGAIPTEFDTGVNVVASSSYGSNYDYIVTAFKQALKDVRVVMNNREMGAFVVETMERVVYN